jgi:hypothetical protein
MGLDKKVITTYGLSFPYIQNTYNNDNKYSTYTNNIDIVKHGK